MRNIYLKSYLLLFAMLLVSGIASAQTGSITGTVTDNSNITLPGVSVTIDGTGIGTATDVNGAYRLNNVAPGTYTLTAKYIGYSTISKTVTVSAGQSVTVSMIFPSMSKLISA